MVVGQVVEIEEVYSIIISSSIAAAGDHIAVPSGLDILMTGLLYKVIFSLARALNSNPQTPSISG